jgi:hypothetical protein
LPVNWAFGATIILEEKKNVTDELSLAGDKIKIEVNRMLPGFVGHHGG